MFKKDLLKKYILYLFRWQLSTPILAPIVALFTGAKPFSGSAVLGAVVANLIGGLIFFWVDKFIFTSPLVAPQWEILEKGKCYDCGKKGRVFRLIKTRNYDKTMDKNPEFRCEQCSYKKLEELRIKGVKV